MTGKFFKKKKSFYSVNVYRNDKETKLVTVQETAVACHKLAPNCYTAEVR